MMDLRHILRRAARRDLAQRALGHAGIGLIVGLIAGFLLLLADRFGLVAASGVIYVIVVGLGAIAGVASAALTGADRASLAIRLDRSFRLADRLATAESLESGTGPHQDRAFAALVRRDADRLAGSLDVRPALPVRMTRVWGGVAALAVLLWLASLYVPSMSPARGADAETMARRVDSLRQERAAVAESIRDVVENLEDEAQLDEEARGELDALDELASQLSGENAEEFDPSAVRDESAARINELADRLAEQARENTAAADELTRRFAGLDPPEAPMSAEEFSEALRRGDFGRAADLLDELMQDKEAMTEQERQAIADHLRALGEQIEEAPLAADPAGDVRRQRLQQALRDQDLTGEEIEGLLNPRPPAADDVQRELENRNVDEEISRELAKDIEQLRNEQDIDDQATRDARDVARAVKQAADSMQPPENGEPPPETDRSADQQPSPAGDDRPGSQHQQTPSGEERQSTGAVPDQSAPPDGTGEPRQEGQTEAEQAKPGSGPPQRPADAQAGEPEKQPGAQSAEQTPSTRPPQPAEEQPGREPGAEQSPPERVPGQQPAGQRADEQEGDELPGPEAGGPGQRSDREPEQLPQASPDRRQDEAEPSPAEVIRELERRRQIGQRQREAVDRARQIASEMAENMTEDERRRWAEQWRREFGMTGAGAGDEASNPPDRDDAKRFASPEIDELDLSDDELASRMIAEWLSDQPTGSAPAATESGPSSQRVRQAQRAAERAVEDAAVPSRYHRLIREYFGRLEETIDKAAEKSEQGSSATADPDPPPKDNGES